MTVTSIPIESDSPPPLPDQCPISSLLGKRLSQMNDAELEEHVKKIRAARESPQIMRSLLSGKPKKAKSVKVNAKPDLSLLD